MVQRLIVSIWFVVVMTNCSSEPLISGNDLEIIVTDAEENIAPQSIVKLFISKSHYEDGFAFDSLITDEQGTAQFYGIDPQITEIYVEASKGNATNWGYRHFVALVPGQNRMITKMEDSRENILVGKLGREWQQIGFVVDGISNEECQYRRVYRFERGGNLQIYTSDDCTWAENFFNPEEVWQLRFQNIVIGSPTNPAAQRNGFIQILDDDNLQFFYQRQGANGTSTYVESFEALD